MVTRGAHIADLDEIHALAMAFHREFREHFGPKDDAAVRAMILASIEFCPFPVAEVNDRIVGAIPLRMDRFWYDPGRNFLTDVFFYVWPEHRTYERARALIEAAKRLASYAAVPLCLAVSSGTDLDRKDALFRRAGFRHIGAIYRWS